MSTQNSIRALVIAMSWLVLAAGAMADDWVVDRLRGQVQVEINGSWRDLVRGDVVSDDSPIKSLDGSRVTFARGPERIELSGATEIRIFDRAGERMTTVMQAYGTVTVEAERLNIQHFSVQTPYLAAIVKGTRFTVVSDDSQSNVRVERGVVQVQDGEHELVTDILPGQTAVVSDVVALQVTGAGAIAPIMTFDGVPAVQAVAGSTGDEPEVPNDGSTLAASDDSGNSNENGNSGNGNGNGNAGNGSNENGNAGNGNNGNENDNENESESGNNGNGNAGNGNNGNGNGNSGNGNAGNGNNGNGNGNSGNGNAGNGNNGNGNANGHNKSRDDDEDEDED